jgi:mannosyltransferase OCH1-like enzyme
MFKAIINLYFLFTEILGAFPFKILKNQKPRLKSKKIKIPKVIYQTWMSNKIPKNFYYSIMEFRKANSDFKFILKTDEDIDEYMFKNWRNKPIYKIYKKFNLGALKADIWRYCMLYDNGGFYFDLKSGFSGSLTKIVNRDTKLFVTNEENRHTTDIKKNFYLKYPKNFFAQWAFGCTKKSVFLKNLINFIPENYNMIIERYRSENKKKFKKINTKDFILNCTGPNIFSKILRKYILEVKNKNIQQAGIDFYGRGIYLLKFSRMRFLQNRHYTKLNIKI